MFLCNKHSSLLLNQVHHLPTHKLHILYDQQTLKLKWKKLENIISFLDNKRSSLFPKRATCGLYYKRLMIVIYDTSTLVEPILRN